MEIEEIIDQIRKIDIDPDSIENHDVHLAIYFMKEDGGGNSVLAAEDEAETIDLAIIPSFEDAMGPGTGLEPLLEINDIPADEIDPYELEDAISEEFPFLRLERYFE